MSVIPIVVSIAFIVLGAPLAARAVGPNRWYGVRTSKTLSDLQVWYDVNSTGGKALIVAGIASLISLILLNHFWTGSPDLKNVIAIAIPLVLLAVVCIFVLVID